MSRNEIEGTDGKDMLVGTVSGDLILGLDGADDLSGGKGNDVLRGGKGNDTLDGGGGKDRLLGGNGKDALILSGGADEIDGGAGVDVLDASGWDAGIYWNLRSFDSTDFGTTNSDGSFVRIPAGTLLLANDGHSPSWTAQTAVNVEDFNGSKARDYIITSGSFGVVKMRGGDDSFSADTVTSVRGGNGDDRLPAKTGKLFGDKGDDVLSGGQEIGSLGAKLFGGRGNDTLIVSGPTEARGGVGNDTILVLSARKDSFLEGGRGADVFEFNSSGSAGGIMQDFEPGVDRIDISSYLNISGEGWEDLQDMFESRPEGVTLKLDLQRFSNQEFTFAGLTRADLSESDFILT